MKKKINLTKTNALIKIKIKLVGIYYNCLNKEITLKNHILKVIIIYIS